MELRDLGSLHDILHAARQARSYIEGLEFDQFSHDYLHQDGVIRQLLVVGEAAARLSQAARDVLTSIPWRQWIGMRNRLVHAYDLIDLEIVWLTAHDELPALISAIEVILDSHK